MEFDREGAGRTVLYTWLYGSFHGHYLAVGLDGFWKCTLGVPSVPCPVPSLDVWLVK